MIQDWTQPESDLCKIVDAEGQTKTYSTGDSWDSVFQGQKLTCVCETGGASQCSSDGWCYHAKGSFKHGEKWNWEYYEQIELENGIDYEEVKKEETCTCMPSGEAECIRVNEVCNVDGHTYRWNESFEKIYDGIVYICDCRRGGYNCKER